MSRIKSLLLDFLYPHDRHPLPDERHDGPVLDLGCGDHARPGTVGVDLVRTRDTRLVCDLSAPLLPFGDNSVQAVVSYHLIEHLEDVEQFLVELHRIVRPAGYVYIVTPHYTSWASWADHTHVQHFGVNTFYRLTDKEYWGDNFIDLYDVEYVKLRFGCLRRLPLARLLGLETLANMNPRLCERLGLVTLHLGGLDVCARLHVLKSDQDRVG